MTSHWRPASAGWCRSGSTPIRGMAAPVRAPVSAAAQDQQAALTAAVRSFGDVGITAEVVSAGSTPTVAFSTSSVITEIRPGEYVFCDMDNTRLGACRRTRSRCSSPPRWSATGSQTRSSSTSAPRPWAARATPRAGTAASPARRRSWRSSTSTTGSSPCPAGESRPSVGTVVPVVPNHVCPVVISFEELIVTDSEGTIAATVAGRRPRTPQLTGCGTTSPQPEPTRTTSEE